MFDGLGSTSVLPTGTTVLRMVKISYWLARNRVYYVRPAKQLLLLVKCPCHVLGID